MLVFVLLAQAVATAKKGLLASAVGALPPGAASRSAREESAAWMAALTDETLAPGGTVIWTATSIEEEEAEPSWASALAPSARGARRRRPLAAFIGSAASMAAGTPDAGVVRPVTMTALMPTAPPVAAATARRRVVPAPDAEKEASDAAGESERERTTTTGRGDGEAEDPGAGLEEGEGAELVDVDDEGGRGADAAGDADAAAATGDADGGGDESNGSTLEDALAIGLALAMGAADVDSVGATLLLAAPPAGTGDALGLLATAAEAPGVGVATGVVDALAESAEEGDEDTAGLEEGTAPEFEAVALGEG